MDKTQLIQYDDVSLQERLATLIKHKIIILTSMVITAVLAVTYVYTTTPVYRGTVLVEIGEVILNITPLNDKPTLIKLLENIGDFQGVLEREFNASLETGHRKIKFSTPKNSERLVLISYDSTDKKKIQGRLEEVIRFTLNRHQQSAEFFQKANVQIKPSAVIGPIVIGSFPVGPGKGLVVALVLIIGISLGVFFAFFREFIVNWQKNVRK